VLLDEVMPEYDVHEVHSMWVAAQPAAAAYDAVLRVSTGRCGLFGPLMWLRTVGRSARIFDPKASLLADMLLEGFFHLAERPGEEIVVGAIGRFWSLFGNRPQVVDDFLAFDEPGYAKATLNFHVLPEGNGSRITTETRVIGTDAEATRKFRRYWFLIRLGSGAIRRSWLNAIRRRLEQTHPESDPGHP
jgi:hypothetical protein